MRIIFMGTPAFAVPSLEALNNSHEVCAVVTRQDAPSKRGKKLYPSEVKAKAIELGLEPIIETNSLKSADIQGVLQALAPDLIVVAAYGALLPQSVLDIAPCVNVHASLLPRWRGAAPIERAILAGDKKAGVSIMQMERGLDTGAYTHQVSKDILDKTACELEAELSVLGAKALIACLEAMQENRLVWTKQDESQVTYAHKIDKAEMYLSPELSAKDFVRKVQASSDSAPAKLRVFDRTVRILASQLSNQEVHSGHVCVQKKAVILGLEEGSVSIDVIKPDGKKEMPIQSFIAGIKQDSGTWSHL